MTSERMKELNREWRKLCMPIYIRASTVVMVTCVIMIVIAIAGELYL